MEGTEGEDNEGREVRSRKDDDKKYIYNGGNNIYAENNTTTETGK